MGLEPPGLKVHCIGMIPIPILYGMPPTISYTSYTNIRSGDSFLTPSHGADRNWKELVDSTWYKLVQFLCCSRPWYHAGPIQQYTHYGAVW